MWGEVARSCAGTDDADAGLKNGDTGLAPLLCRTDASAGEMFREVHSGLLAGINTTFPLATPTIAREIGAHGGPVRAALLILTMHAHGADLRDDGELRKRVALAARATEYLAAFPSLLAGVTSERSDGAEKSTNALVILIGDFALSRSLLAGAEIGPHVAAELGRVAREACEGGQMDVADRYDLDRPIGRYLSATALRVGSVFGFAAALGAELAGASGRVVGQARRWGCELGVAYQIAEDVRDMGLAPGDSAQEGVSALLRGRYALPVLLAAQKDRGTRRALAGHLGTEDLARIGDLIRATDSVGEAEKLMEGRILCGKEALRGACLVQPESLSDFSDWIWTRAGGMSGATTQVWRRDASSQHRTAPHVDAIHDQIQEGA